MKRLTILLTALLLSIFFVDSALAGGGPPPADVLKGLVLKINDDNSLVFKKDGTETTRILVLDESLTVKDVPLNTKVMIGLDKEKGENVVKDISRMFIDITATKLIALLVVGLIGGLLSGFIGSGGAFVLTPAMMSLGVPGAIAVASNMCHKFPKAMVGTFKRYKYGQVDIKLGLIMATTAIIGVQIGIVIQKFILKAWGNAGSNLYVSVVFVVILVVVGYYVFNDAKKLAKGGGEAKTSKLALKMQSINLPPMIHFKTANLTISFWVTVPVGLATGMLAATIAVGGFIGVPGMIYIVGASAIVASATELLIAFVMGFWGSVQWGLSGLVDIRLTLLILATSLFGVQIGALGTTYVKDHIIKIVMGTVMLIVAVSRGAKIPGYLADLGIVETINPNMQYLLNQLSFWALVAALGSAGIIITVAMVKGMIQDKASKVAVKGIKYGEI